MRRRQQADDELMEVDSTTNVETSSDVQRDEHSDRLTHMNEGDEPRADDRQVGGVNKTSF